MAKLNLNLTDKQKEALKNIVKKGNFAHARRRKMTKEEAISKAADWWVEMIFRGIWDNGDSKTEAVNAVMKSMVPGPQPCNAETLRKIFVELVTCYNNLYCDYGNSYIDSEFSKHNLPFRSNIHCPQKAGTSLREQNGEWIVEAKSGYGKSYERI